jgi:hypothetical protein
VASPATVAPVGFMAVVSVLGWYLP